MWRIVISLRCLDRWTRHSGRPTNGKAEGGHAPLGTCQQGGAVVMIHDSSAKWPSTNPTALLFLFQTVRHRDSRKPSTMRNCTPFHYGYRCGITPPATGLPAPSSTAQINCAMPIAVPTGWVIPITSMA